MSQTKNLDDQIGVLRGHGIVHAKKIKFIEHSLALALFAFGSNEDYEHPYLLQPILLSTSNFNGLMITFCICS